MSSGNILIDRDTTIQLLLDSNQDVVIEELVKLNKNFGKLKNPLLRKLFAKRVSIAEACKVANCSVSDFLLAMNKLGFKLNSADDAEHEPAATSGFEDFNENDVVDLDVRPILDEGKDPLKQIMLKINELKEGQSLKIINSFEPLPLKNLLEKKGFKSHSEFINTNLVYTWFFKSSVSTSPDPVPVLQKKTDNYSFDDLLKLFEGKLIRLDVCKYEMPKPMVAILDTLEGLEEGHALFVQHKKIPVYLLPHLRDKGFQYLIREENATNVSLLIYR